MNGTASQYFKIPAGNPRGSLLGPGNLVEWSEEVVYLGLTLDSKLIFRTHIVKTRTKCQIGTIEKNLPIDKQKC